MYPGGELAALAARKERLRLQIAVRREECALACDELIQPFAWVDRVAQFWQQISPLAKVVGVPLGLVLARKLTRRIAGGKWMTLARLLPFVWQITQSFIQPARNGTHPVRD